MTELVLDERMTLPRRLWKNKGRANKIRRLGFLALLTILVGLWTFVIHLQLTHRYYCRSVYVEFNDGLVSTLSEFPVALPASSGISNSSEDAFLLHSSLLNGVYKQNRNENLDRKIPVFRRDFKDGALANAPNIARGIFSYDERENAWVFSIENGLDHNSGVDWLMRSPATDPISLETTPSLGWTLWSGKLVSGGDHFSFHCASTLP
mmetsp:Transcript_2661/g.6963  ORF Transcript_2661/g.6963 Transcript_2661/m.6963 type:complete len:207 (-) Transcript_2661:32-652(-)